MPKLKDILGHLTNVINNDEFTAVVGSSEPWQAEITDEGFEQIKNSASSLMTYESAINNEKVVNALTDRVDQEKASKLYKEAMAAHYDKTEEKLTSVGEYFGVDLKGKKLDDQLAALKTVNLSKGKENFQQEITALHSQLGEKDKEIEKIKQESETKLIDFQKNMKFDSMLEGYNLAEAYKDPIVKRGIFNSIKDEINAKATVKLTESGLTLYKKDDPTLEYFEGNKRAELKDLLDPLMSKYVSKKVETKVNGKFTPTTPEANTEDRSARGLIQKGQVYI